MSLSGNPIRIQVNNEEQVLEIQWGGDHRTEFPLYGLRKNCPCVSCRGGHDKMNSVDSEAFLIENPPLMNISGIKQIGNHAIQITWVDGHNAGMYTWERLKILDSHIE